MADQVTISTFLELRDNLSPGLARVQTNLNRLHSTVDVLTKQIRLMGATATVAGRGLAAVDLSAARTVGAIRRLGRTLASATRDARDLATALKAVPTVRPPTPPPASATGGADVANRRSLVRQMVEADLIASGIRRIVSNAYDKLNTFLTKGVQLNYAYEKSVSAISSAMYTMGVSPSMAVAQEYTENVLSVLRRMAAVLPGEAADYVEVFQRTIPSALQSGMRDTQKYAEFVSKYTAVAIQRGVSAKVAATNLQIMLNGTARAGTKMAQVLSAYTGKTINDINRMSREARLDLLQKATDQAASGMAAAADKMDAVYGTFKSYIEEISRLGSQPFFEDLKGTLKDLNKWIGDNKASIVELGKVISESMGSALAGVVETLKSAVSLMNDLTKNSKSVKQMSYEERIARTTEVEAGAGRSLRDLIPFYGLYARFKDIGDAEKIARLAEEDMKATKKWAEAQKRFRPREKELSTFMQPTGTIAELATQATTLMQKGMFKVPGMQMKDAFSDYMMEVVGLSGEYTQKIWEELIRRKVVKSEVQQPPKERPTANYDFRNSRFDIKQEFAQGFDPDRIAVAFANDLGRLGEMKLQAAYGQVGAVR